MELHPLGRELKKLYEEQTKSSILQKVNFTNYKNDENLQEQKFANSNLEVLSINKCGKNLRNHPTYFSRRFISLR